MKTLETLAEMTAFSTEVLGIGFTAITDTLTNLGNVIGDVSLEPAIKALFGEGEIEGAAEGFMTVMEDSAHNMTLLMTYIERLSTSVASLVEAFNILEEAGSIKEIEINIQNSVSSITSSLISLGSLVPNMAIYGSRLMQSFISGINAWKGILIATMQDVANIIKAYLGVSSPTEKGALAKLNEWPKNLVRSFSGGIKAEMPALNASFTGMSAPISGGGGGNRTSVVLNVTQNITDRTTADYSTRELERLINKHQVM